MGFTAHFEPLIAVLAATPTDAIQTQMERPIMGITTDSRTIPPGSLFLALEGERFDGHEFVEMALQAGAIAAVVHKPIPNASSLPLLQVADTLAAYQAIARWWRQHFTIPIVAVTGSVGKTTTKEFIAAVLGTQGRVLKTQANYNNEIGVPKTLLELSAEHDYAVIEMGMRAPGEIALLTQIAQPNIAVITNVGTAHIGRLGSEAAIAQAKCELLAELAPSGVGILNAENPLLMTTADSVWSGRTVRYGLEQGDLRAGFQPPDRLDLDGMVFPVPLPGRHNAMNYLAALAVARELGIAWEPLTAGLDVQLPQGRARRYPLPNDVVLLDETYNAGLESMTAALHLLAETPGRRHIAVLGTMKELGERSPDFHCQVGAIARDLKLDGLLILADAAESRAMTAGFSPNRAEEFASHADLVKRLQTLIQPGDRILFKASRAVGMDQVVSQLLDTMAIASGT
jgi:UDP-N-acetylmuramoyl-tripeptide--D-alanyl-D-alanine ligase